MRKKFTINKSMVDSLHSMIAAHQDNFIEALDFGVLGPPSASYMWNGAVPAYHFSLQRMPRPAPGCPWLAVS